MVWFIIEMLFVLGWNLDVGGIMCQDSFVMNFGQVLCIVLVLVLVIWLGEFVNVFVMVKMKVMFKGKVLY